MFPLFLNLPNPLSVACMCRGQGVFQELHLPPLTESTADSFLSYYFSPGTFFFKEKILYHRTQ